VPYRLITLAVEALIAGCALALALLGGYLLLGDGLPALAGVAGVTPPSVAWPSPFTAAARLLLWPVTRPFGQEPALAGPGAILAAMALYGVLTVAAIGVIKLQSRSPRKT
jgi:hypothetical protein